MLLNIIIIGGVSLGLYCGYRIISDFGLDLASIIFIVIAIFGGFLIGWLVAFIINLIVSNSANITYVNIKTENIYALKDGMGISGNSFLGTGTIDSRLKVYYITKDENNAISIQSHDLNSDVTIIQDGKNYVITKQAEYTNNTTKYLFNYPLSNDKYEFHIPEGSITTDIKIDLN